MTDEMITTDRTGYKMLVARALVCNDCGDTVEVYEEPREFTDPARYRCLLCLDPRQRPEQAELELVASPTRTETRSYDPAQAAIPF